MEIDFNLSDCMTAEEIYTVLDQCSQGTLKELKELGLSDRLTQEELLYLCSMVSEQAYNELVELGVFGPTLTTNQVLQLCSGTDADGEPNAFAVLTVDTVTEDTDTIPYASVAFGNPVLNLYGSGGCVVVTADFTAGGTFEFRRARDILAEWFDKKNTPEFKNRLLSLVISPVLLNGQLVTIYHEAVYAQGIQLDAITYRLIIAFDNTETQELIASDIRLDELKTQVTNELARREAEAKAAAQTAVEEAENDYNAYEEAIRREYAIDNEVYLPNPEDVEESGNQESTQSPWMRIAKD